jgi:hypothetical protein
MIALLVIVAIVVFVPGVVVGVLGARAIRRRMR